VFLGDTLIVDTFAAAFRLRFARLLVTQPRTRRPTAGPVPS